MNRGKIPKFSTYQKVQENLKKSRRPSKINEAEGEMNELSELSFRKLSGDEDPMDAFEMVNRAKIKNKEELHSLELIARWPEQWIQYETSKADEVEQALKDQGLEFSGPGIEGKIPDDFSGSKIWSDEIVDAYAAVMYGGGARETLDEEGIDYGVFQIDKRTVGMLVHKKFSDKFDNIVSDFREGVEQNINEPIEFADYP